MVNIKDYLHKSKSFLYEKEVREFLSSFSPDKSDEKLEQTFSIIFQKWEKDGFVSLQNLRKHICYSLMSIEGNAADKAKKNMIDNLIDGTIKKDTLTGFYAKTECPLVTGLADLYHRTTGHNVYRVEGDFSNMGGTNLFFREAMRESRGLGRRDSDGFAYTDNLVSISSRMMYSVISKAVEAYNREGNTPPAFVHPFRSGGDEIRFIVTGLDNEKTNNFIVECDAVMKKFVKDNHLGTHDNPKDSRRPGFGLALAAVPLTTNNSFNSGVEADRIIGIKKLVSSVDNLYDKAALSGDKAKDFLDMADTINSELNKRISADLRERGYPDNEVARAIAERNRLAHLKRENILNSPHSQINKGLVLNAVEFISQDPKYAAFTGISPVPDGVSLSVSNNNSFFADIDVLYEQIVTSRAKSIMIKNPDDLYLISSLAKNFASIDSSTDAKMANTLYNVMGRNQKDGQEYDIDRFIKDVKELQQARGLNTDCQIKVAHIEFGNLAGMNNLSHDFGDALLKGYSDIIKKTLREASIGDDLSHAIYSEGGGKFKVALPEYYETKDANGNVSAHHIDDKFMGEITAKIKESVEKEINGKNITEFCVTHRLSTDFSNVVDDKLQQILSNPDAKIVDIPNPKRISEHGIKVDSAITSIGSDGNASDQLNKFTNDFEATLRQKREIREKIATRAFKIENIGKVIENHVSESVEVSNFDMRRAVAKKAADRITR